ncbi:hypothetical protein EDB19DRAFT_1906490 [Suillus lakei]|nr:hypothetical protein EDB19DRAFT_1906490 [Suillus lakei]
MDGPMESSLLDNNIISHPFHTNSPFPAIPVQSTFVLRPAIFEPETPTLPIRHPESVITQTTLAASTIPPISRPEFNPKKTIPPAQNSTTTTSQPGPALIQPNPPLVIPLTTPSQPATIMSAANKGISTMPGPRSSKAPTFNGETSELLEFLELFEDLASSCALTDTDKCKMIVCYINLETKTFWVSLTRYKSKDYTVFKANILAQYSGAAKGQRYSICDLEHVVINSVNNDISTETELLQYYRQFCPITHWLISNSKISVWLELKDTNYSQMEATDFKEVLKAGCCRVQYFCGLVEEGCTIRTKAPAPWDSDDEEERKDIRREVQTKWVTFTSPPPAPVKNMINEVEVLACKMHSLDIGNIAYSGCYTQLVCLAPAATQAWAPQKFRQLVNTPVPAQNALPYLPLPPLPSSSNYTPNAKCFFCGGSHIMCTCSMAGEYLCAGQIIRDRRFFAYPDRSQIRHYGDETFKQVIDAQYTTPHPLTPATGSNSIIIKNPQLEPSVQPTPPDIPSSAFISESYFLQCKPVTENHTVIVTVEEDNNKQMAEALAIT